MQSIRRCCNISPVVSLFCLTVLSLGSQALAQPVSGEVCKPISDRTGDLGCWIIAHEPIGQLNQSQVFWHLDVYPTREAAEAAKGPQGTVVDSLGKTWLLTIAEEGWRPIGGERVAEIGPLPITAGEKYSALGGDLHSRNDVTGAHSLGSRGLVYFNWRNVFRNAPRQTGRTRRRAARHRARRSADALDRNWHRNTPCNRSRPPQLVKARVKPCQ